MQTRWYKSKYPLHNRKEKNQDSEAQMQKSLEGYRHSLESLALNVLYWIKIEERKYLFFMP